ncbi:MAG TPA: shikimate dehydrogenase [Candidatus Saccharimonadales bacterium]|nr:shikimate dehydrogenase [Candidatus Saccharimonadales bacterium]
MSNITARTNICMVIGDPIEHSLSPHIHNAGYEALGIDDQFVYVASRVEISDIEDFTKGIRAMNIRGVSCTIPHKVAVMPHLDEVEDIAKKIGAVNTIVNENGRLIGYNTDWLGVLIPLESVTNLENKTVALIGAGGAARAVAYAVTCRGAKLTVYNRTFEKGKELAKEFGGIAYRMDNIENVKDADILINTTPVGLHDKNETPVSKKYITEKHIVFDAVYGDETQLIKDAKGKGAQTIDGIEMLLNQGFAQFKLFTGFDAPAAAMRKVLK